jgi:hypothetical protein
VTEGNRPRDLEQIDADLATMVEVGRESVSGLDDAEVREAAGYLTGAALTYLPVKDDDGAQEWLIVMAMRRAREECEKARERLGHYPLCDALDHPEDVDNYCTCEGWDEP